MKDLDRGDSRLDFMKCICSAWPDKKCWQYEHHLEHAGHPLGFPRAAFPRDWAVGDLVVTNAVVHLSFVERVLLLFRPLSIKVRVYCETPPGRVSGHTEAWASRWRWPWQKNGAVEVSAQAEKS